MPTQIIHAISRQCGLAPLYLGAILFCFGVQLSGGRAAEAQERDAIASPAPAANDEEVGSPSDVVAPATPESTQPVENNPMPVQIGAPPETTTPPATSARGADVTPDEAARILLQQLDRPTEPELRFNFSGASWQDVLTWLADEAKLSLQIDRFPAGSVSFSDPTRTYTVSESLDLLNRLLLDRGYALIRRGRMLVLIDLEAENSEDLMSELADFVRPDDLAKRGKSDIVTSVFPLGSMTPDEAKQQIPQLIAPFGKVIVLDSARQVKVTERAERLLEIRDVISQSAEQVHEIRLEHRSAEELLQTARPLLGLEAGVNSNDDIRISVGLYGDRIYATGTPSKVAILESLITKADQPLDVAGDENAAEVERPELKTYPVRDADVASVYEVLQTLLQDEPGVRLAVDPVTQNLIALGGASVHAKVSEVIAEMAGSGEEFKVFQLNRIDPSQALLTINKYFGITEESTEGPIVDGDPTTGRMWVRGSKEEVSQIETLLEQLDGATNTGLLGGRVRTLSLAPGQSEQVLQQLQLYWKMTGRPNSIRVVSPAGSATVNGIQERRLQRPGKSQPPTPEAEQTDQPGQQPSASPVPGLDVRNLRSLDRVRYISGKTPAMELTYVSEPFQEPAVSNPSATVPEVPPPAAANGLSAEIVLEITPDGIRIASDDIEALDELEALLSQLIGPTGVQNDLPTIFWLKYIQADIAAEMVAEIMGGADSSGGLVDTIAGGLGGGMLGGIMGLATGGGGGGGSTSQSILTTTGSVSIVPDLRLNALFIQANDLDMQTIEMILQTIDREESPEDIELTSKPRLIPVIHQDATQMASIIKEMYASKIGGQQQGGGGGRSQGQPSPQDFINALRGGGRGGRGGQESAKSEPTKIAVAVDERSNSLIITSTTQDFEEIRALVSMLDEMGQANEEQTVFYNPKGTLSGQAVYDALNVVLGQQQDDKPSQSNTNSQNGRTNSSSSPSSSDAEAARARFEAFRARFGGGGSPFGGGRPGGGGASGGGRPGGGGGPGGGGPGGGGRGGR